MKIGAVTPSTLQTQLGPVEYASVGDGAPVLVLHGSPGGIDAAELMARFLPRERCRAILMSRPGYLGTELGARRTLDEQADLLAAVLDALDVDRAGVLAWSGGGPVAYRLAVRHPGRVRAIVAIAALSGVYRLPKQDPVTRLIFGTAAGEWLTRLLAARAPDQIVRGTLSSEGALTPEQLRRRTAEVMADDVKRAFVLGLAPTASRRGRRRRPGWRNDLEQFGLIESLELHAVEAPCLLVHGDVDTDVVPEHSRRAAGVRAADPRGGNALRVLHRSRQRRGPGPRDPVPARPVSGAPRVRHRRLPTTIEASFRMSKHDLAARPIYHHKRESIDAHLTIVLAALACR